MPRGGAQIVQAPGPCEGWLKPYSRDVHTEDAATWRALATGRAVRGSECWPAGFEQSRYWRDFLDAGKLRYLAAAPVEAPVFPGYDGALHVYRTVEQGDFSDAEMRALAEVGREMGRVAAETRLGRLQGECANPHAWLHSTSTRQIILDSSLKSLLDEGMGDIDSRVADQILHDARHRLSHLSSEATTSARLPLADADGELWNFQVAAYRRYPALSDGPVVFYCLTPGYCDWSTLRPVDVGADTELSRLVPAAQFMVREYQQSPRLDDIAKTVHVSPFHFHRRFSELMGITPKHLLLECQIFEAERLLVAQHMELADIAKTCGFAHQSHFTSRFKQATGLTPTRWRKLALRTVAEPARGRVSGFQKG